MQVDIGFFFSDFFYKNIIFFNQLVFIKEKTLIRGVSGHFLSLGIFVTFWADTADVCSFFQVSTQNVSKLF